MNNIMEEFKADPDTQVEVNTLILDYLVCTAINTFLYTQKQEEQGQSQVQNAAWLLNTVNNLTPILEHSETLSPDLGIKLELLRFINACCQSISPSTAEHQGCASNHDERTAQRDASKMHTLSNQKSFSAITAGFLSLCMVADDYTTGTNWVDIAAQLMLEAAFEQHQICLDPSLRTFHEQMDQAPESVKRTPKWEQVTEKYKKYIQPPPGVPLPTHLETTRRQLHRNQLGDTLIDFLFFLMKKLNPPVLLQLERGKLCGLSRAETQELKNRVGLR